MGFRCCAEREKTQSHSASLSFSSPHVLPDPACKTREERGQKDENNIAHHEVAVPAAGARVLLVLAAGGLAEVRHGRKLRNDRTAWDRGRAFRRQVSFMLREMEAAEQFDCHCVEQLHELHAIK